MPKALHFLAFCTHDSVFVRGKERIAGNDDLIGITTAEACAAELYWKSPSCHDGAGALPEDALNSETFTSGMSHEATGHGVQSGSCSIFRPNDAIAEPGVRNHGRLMERAVPWHRGFIHIAL